MQVCCYKRKRKKQKEAPHSACQLSITETNLNNTKFGNVSLHDVLNTFAFENLSLHVQVFTFLSSLKLNAPKSELMAFRAHILCVLLLSVATFRGGAAMCSCAVCVVCIHEITISYILFCFLKNDYCV